MQLRDYQRRAVEAVYDHLRQRDDNPVVVLPTGSGKSAVIATLCDDAVTRWGGRVLVLAHVKELLEQIVATLDRIAPHLHVGLYSAGLKRRDTEHPVIVAGIQSVWRRAAEIDAFDLIVCDEAHLLAPDGEGMYRTFLADARKVNPHVRLIGLTATPFRLSSGMICGPQNLLNHICCEVGVKELIRDGYLCPLRTKAGVIKADTASLHVRAGEFIADEVEQLMDQDSLVAAACREIVEHTRERQSVLLFASGVQHGRHIVDVLRRDHGVECGFVSGDTPDAERQRLIARFRRQHNDGLFESAGPLKFLCNVNVLTTGFDAPNVDCIALLRPTLSPGLYSQMVGRGLRRCEGKSDCLILDFGGNVLRHGPIDALRINTQERGRGGEAPAKECPQCQALVAAGYSQCPECGHVFPEREKAKHDATADSAGILSGQVTVSEHAVSDVFYRVHIKRDAPPEHPRTLRVEYEVGWHRYLSEWVCFDHPPGSYARAKAEAWWRMRSCLPPPVNVADAVALANAGVLAPTLSVTVRAVAGEKYDRIIDCVLGAKPDPAELSLPEPPEDAPLPECVEADTDLPF